MGEASIRKADHHGIGILFGGSECPTVVLQKDVHQDKGDAFVTIHKGVILAQMISIGSRFLAAVPIQPGEVCERKRLRRFLFLGPGGL